VGWFTQAKIGDAKTEPSKSMARIGTLGVGSGADVMVIESASNRGRYAIATAKR
jgi:hypothetical protein